MTCIDKIERDSDRKGAPRADRYYNPDVVATIYCKVRRTWFASKRYCHVAALPMLPSSLVCRNSISPLFLLYHPSLRLLLVLVLVLVLVVLVLDALLTGTWSVEHLVL